MKKALLALCVLCLVAASGLADPKQPVKKQDRALEGTIKTRIGTLEFIKRYPIDGRTMIVPNLPRNR